MHKLVDPPGTGFSLHCYFNFQRLMKNRISLWLKPTFRHNFTFSLLLVFKWTVFCTNFMSYSFFSSFSNIQTCKDFFFPSKMPLVRLPTKIHYIKSNTFLSFWFQRALFSSSYLWIVKVTFVSSWKPAVTRTLVNIHFLKIYVNFHDTP